MPDLVRRARELGMRALGLTDLQSLGGVWAFCKACRDHGVRPVIGCEFRVTPTSTRVAGETNHGLVLLAEGEAGYRNLVRLVTRSQASSVHGQPLLRADDLVGNAAGLVALIGGEATELYDLVAGDRPDEAESHISRMVRIFGRDNIVFELQDFGQPRQAQVAEKIYRLSRFLNMRCVATNDVHYLAPEESVCHEFLRGERAPAFFDFHERTDTGRWRHLASASDMVRKFEKYPQAVVGTLELAERCAFEPNFEKKRFPAHDFVRGFDADSYLWDLTFREARNLFPQMPAELKARLNEEFDHIRSNGLSNNILLLHGIAQHCRRNRYCTGVGRGNVISSLVAFILGITQINPLEHQLRFLGFAPDSAEERALSVEVPWRAAEELQRYLVDSFGSDSCAAVGRYAGWTQAALTGEILRWLNYTPGDYELAAGKLKDKPPAPDAPMDRFFPRKRDGVALPCPELVRFMAARLRTRLKPLQACEHQFAISGENLNNVVPRIMIDGQSVSQVDAAALDGFSIPRLRIESSSMLNILDLASRWVREQENPSFDPDSIPVDNDEAYAVLCKGLTNGIEPFDTITVKSLLREHRPRNFRALVKVKAAEASPGRDAAGDVREYLPQCLLTYRCAFVKAHYPLSFMTALLTHSYAHSSTKKFRIVLREARQMGLRVNPPDVNKSAFEFTVVPKAIQTGLEVVRRMGRKAYAEIERVRMGGEFIDLVDLCRRTDARLVTSHLLQNLVKVGALDSFHLKRSQMLALVASQLDAARRDISTPSLFDESPEPLLRPSVEVPDLPELSEAEIIRHEMAVAGYCVSFDQLHFYTGLIRQCRALSPYDLGPKLVGREVYLAGFIDRPDPHSPLVEGKDQVLLDMEGRVVTMPTKAANLFRTAITANAPVLVGGKVARRKDEVYLKAHSAFPLRMVQQMAAQVEELTLDLSKENLRTLWLISRLVGAYRGGRTRMHIEGFEAGGWLARMLAGRIAAASVFFCPPFYYRLKVILEEERVVLKAAEGTDQGLLHALSPARFPRSESPEPKPADPGSDGEEAPEAQGTEADEY